VGQSQTGPFDLGALGQQASSGQLTRNSLVWKAMADGWKNIDFKTLPPASVKAIEDGCKQGVDAMKQAMATLGC
jgi:hypothetical protein